MIDPAPNGFLMSLLESRGLRLVGSLHVLRYTVAPCADAGNAGAMKRTSCPD
jgi:hypothetical protein